MRELAEKVIALTGWPALKARAACRRRPQSAREPPAWRTAAAAELLTR